MAEKITDWRGITLIPSDERLVDETLSESNIGMIRKNLIERIHVKDKPTLFSFLDENSSPNCVQSISSLNSQLKSIMPIKAAFLGVGEDGHTASLFSGYERPNNDDKILLSNIKKASELFKRVSLSASYLAKVSKLVFLVSGEKKKSVMERIFSNNKNTDHFPVCNVIKESIGNVTVLCDQSAVPND